MAADILVIGLGNPGPRFTSTRHNVGFDLVEALSLLLKVRVRKALFRPLRWVSPSARTRGIGIVTPLTFMNRSGDVLPWVFAKTNLPLERSVIVVDNMDLPPGEIRMKRRGSSAGHNGLKSVGGALGCDDFPRLYIGVGRPADGVTTVDHVLGHFDEEDRTRVDDAIARVVPVIAAASEMETEQLISAVNARRRE